jgi:hypothetical protein
MFTIDDQVHILLLGNIGNIRASGAVYMEGLNPTGFAPTIH